VGDDQVVEHDGESLLHIAAPVSEALDGYPCYHKPCDKLDQVNVAYLRSMIQMVATASALLAVAEPGQAAS
jgi:hypothetical protein